MPLWLCGVMLGLPFLICGMRNNKYPFSKTFWEPQLLLFIYMFSSLKLWVGAGLLRDTITSLQVYVRVPCLGP